jgi:hypothetical protein
VVTPAVVLWQAGDESHGVVEGQAEDLDAEVDGVASQIALRPAPIAVFDDEAGIGGQNEIARVLREDLESALLEQRGQRGQPGGADLFARQRVDLSDGLVTVFPPMGLNQDAVDLFEVHNAGLVANDFDEGSQAEICRCGATNLPRSER